MQKPPVNNHRRLSLGGRSLTSYRVHFCKEPLFVSTAVSAQIAEHTLSSRLATEPQSLGRGWKSARFSHGAELCTQANISIFYFPMAERVGFEPTPPFPTLSVFKTELFNRLSTFPSGVSSENRTQDKQSHNLPRCHFANDTMMTRRDSLQNVPTGNGS